MPDHREAGVIMKFTPQQIRIGIASAIVLATVGYLAFQGAVSSKSYYVTVPEMNAMGDKAYQTNLRVEGFVKPATIQANGTHVLFTLTEFESHNPKATSNPRSVVVNYQGAEPPPDTFKSDAQALAIGTYGHDGVFHATQLQAKCASKYAPAAPGQPATGQPATTQPANKQASTGSTAAKPTA
jgi:cytochrome c-type biogenesis protein CcmE